MKKLLLLTTLILMTSCASINSYDNGYIGDNYTKSSESISGNNPSESITIIGTLEKMEGHGNKTTTTKQDLLNLPLPTFYRRLDFILNRYKIMWFDVTSLDTLMQLKQMLSGYDGKYKDNIAIRYMGDEPFSYKNMNENEVIAELEENQIDFQRFRSYNYIKNENETFNKIILYNENNPVLYTGYKHLKYDIYKYRIIVEEN